MYAICLAASVKSPFPQAALKFCKHMIDNHIPSTAPDYQIASHLYVIKAKDLLKKFAVFTKSNWVRLYYSCLRIRQQERRQIKIPEKPHSEVLALEFLSQ